MRDQRIVEMLEGRKEPQINDLPLLERVVDKEGQWYNPTELQALKSYVVSLKDSEETVNVIAHAFRTIEKYDLKVATMICTVCGTVFSVNVKGTKPCEHLKQLAKECLEDCED